MSIPQNQFVQQSYVDKIPYNILFEHIRHHGTG